MKLLAVGCHTPARIVLTFELEARETEPYPQK